MWGVFLDSLVCAFHRFAHRGFSCGDGLGKVWVIYGENKVLHGIRLVELSRVLTGPHYAHRLADLGAGPPRINDSGRLNPPNLQTWLPGFDPGQRHRPA
jgi:hypothetical protein